MKNFILIGAAGFIAPRHFKAIKATGNNLLAAMDKSDSVGTMDAYFPNASFFTEFERFDRHIEKQKRTGLKIDFLSVCTPNYLHDAHIRFGLRHGADVICEKPIVLNPWNLEGLIEQEQESGKHVYSILQLRLHPSIIGLRNKVAESINKKWDVELTYISARGNWYYSSWKGDVQKSGGIATNIGLHFFDVLSWIFGDVIKREVHLHSHDRAAGFIEFEKARVKWFLSIDGNTLPKHVVENGGNTYRCLKLEGEEYEFSDGFEDLHTKSYEAILKGEGFRLSETKQAIEMVHYVRSTTPIGIHGEYHPFCELPQSKHPFV